MSNLSLEKLHLVPTIDPRIDILKLEKLLYGVEMVGTENTYKTYPVNGYSTSSIVFTANPPNMNNFVDRKFYMQVKFTLTFRGTSAGAGVFLLQCPGLPSASGVSSGNGAAYYDAPRSNPLSNAMTNLQVSLNGESTSTNLSQYIRALKRYHNSAYNQDRLSSSFPSMQDQFLNYYDGQGFARSELRGYGDNVLQCPRGGYQFALVTRNDSSGVSGQDVATVELTTFEPLYISPLNVSNYQEQPFFHGISTCDINISLGGRGSSSFGGLVGSLWSHAQAPSNFSTIDSVNVDINNVSALFHYITPPLSFHIPKQIVYGLSLPNYIATSFSNAPMSAGSELTLAYSNVQLNSIPEKVYIWVSKIDTAVSYLDTDTYFSITNLDIDFNNKPGVLASASQLDLYNISIRNGLDMNFRQFVKDCGSVICLKFGEDIPLSNLLAPGVSGSFQFSANIRCKNNYNTSIAPTISMLFVNAGTYTIENGACYKNNGILTPQDVLNTQVSNQHKEPAPPAHDALGGISWGEIVSFFKKAGRAAIDVGKKIVPVLAPEFTPVVTGADVLARNLGFALPKKRKAVKRGTKKMAHGGVKLTRKQMLSMMH